MAQVMPDSIPSYYMWLSQKEQYYDALSVFHTFLRTADLSIRINQALAKSGIDEESLKILSDRANRGDANARKILENLTEFLGGITLPQSEEKEKYATSARDTDFEQKLPKPKDYPPKNLSGYFRAAKATNPYERGKCLGPWLDHWISTDRKDEAFQAIVEEEKREGRLALENYDRLYEIALSIYGKDRAYPWLLKAHIERGGWSRYYTHEEEAVRRWQIVKEKYPDKWFDFIKDTMKSVYGSEYEFSVPERIVRLVKYCIFVDQTQLAKSISEEIITSVLELVSPISLPLPEWVKNQ